MEEILNLGQFAHPTEVGTFLSESQIDEVARVLYERFIYDYGLKPEYKTSANTRKIMVRQVKRTLDALSLAGYLVSPAPVESERLPHK